MPAQTHLDALNTDHVHADLKGQSVRGGLVTLSSQGAQFFIQSISTVVLARLLTPADFGLVAMVTAITGLVSAFADFGLSEATIQNKDINHDQVNLLFWISVAIGLGLTFATAALAPVLARLYREPRLVNITLALSLTFLVGSLRAQPVALLKRQMRFSSLAIMDITSYGLAVPIAITLAWRGAGYWAIVSLPLMLNLTPMALSWLMTNWRPTLPRRDVKVGSLVAFGGNVAGSYFTINLIRSADSALIGWYWGAAPLGLYSRAYNLLMLPVRQLSAPAGNVAITTFSKLQGDPERFARYYLRTVNLIAWISAPLFGLLFVAAEPVIVLLLGSQWREAAAVFRILVLSAMGQLLLESSLWLFVSRGCSKELLRLLLIISPIIVASFVVGLPFGIKGVAMAGSLVWLAILPWMLKFAFRGTNLTLLRLGRALLCPISLSLAGILLGESALSILAPKHILPQLLTVGLAFAAVCFSSALLPQVQEEIRSFRNLLGTFGLSRRAVEPTAE